MRKPDARSVLKTLPEDRQKALYEYLQGHTLAEAEAWLATQGIDTGRTALSQFFAWYPLSQQLSAAANMGDAVRDILREVPGLDLDEERLSKAGQAIFEAQALQAQDSELYLALRKLRQNDTALALQEETGRTKARQKEQELKLKDEDLQLARKKYQRDTCRIFLKWFADEQAKQIVTGGGTNAEKIEALGRKMFGEDWDE